MKTLKSLRGGASHRDPEKPAAHVSDCLALLPSGPDAVRRLKLHRFRAAVRRTGPAGRTLPCGFSQCILRPDSRQLFAPA